MSKIRTLTPLDELYRQAAKATATGSKSFYFATRFFPPDLARAAHAVYWFCRYTDDLADECTSQERGRRDIEDWATLLSQSQRSGTTEHPVLQVFLDTARAHEIPLEYAFELIDGMRMDLTKNRYANFAELRLFCYRVASVVGLMMSRVIGFENLAATAHADSRAIDLGIAMQLTNILRDVGEDLKRGRIYLPLDEMARFGCSEQDILEGRRDQAFREMMRFQVNRARGYYRSGNAGIGLLSRRGRFSVQVASDVYRDILQRIEASDFDVFARRAIVPTRRKYWLMARHVTGPMTRRVLSQIVSWSI